MALVSAIEKFVDNLRISVKLGVSFTKIKNTINIIQHTPKKAVGASESQLATLSTNHAKFTQEFLALMHVEEEIRFWKDTHEQFGRLIDQLDSYMQVVADLTDDDLSTLEQVLDKWQPHVRDFRKNPIQLHIHTIRTNFISELKPIGRISIPSAKRLQQLEKQFTGNFAKEYRRAIEGYNRLYDISIDGEECFIGVLQELSEELSKIPKKSIDCVRIKSLSEHLQADLSIMMSEANQILIRLLTLLDISFTIIKGKIST